MSRRLLPTTDDPQHPMRRTLPPPARPVRDDDKDLKLFALSFTAFFVCFYTLIM